MNGLIELGNRSLFSLGNLDISVLQTVILVIWLVLILMLDILNRRFIRKGKLLIRFGERFKNLISKSISYVIWLVGLAILLRLENINTHAFFSYALFTGDKIVITVKKVFLLIVIIFLIRLIVLLVDFLISRKIERDNLDYGKAKSVLQIIKYFIWSVGIILGIGSMGLELTFIIASVSALLVGLGFGLQNIFNDFFSGIIILFDNSIKVNDIVQVGDIVGKVTEIGIRSTKVLNRDNIILIIPNSKFTTDNVINWSHMDDKSRFNVAVGVAYGSDIRLVEKILLSCADECKDVEDNPKPFVRFEDFGDSSLDFRLYFWTTHSFTVENTKSMLRFAIDQKFRENQVSIPFPQRDVHIKKSL
ncbi:MAG: mechanosensitive ion channel family protein [Prolixibacteraceae bacterium]